MAEKRVENPDLIEELGSRVHNKLNHSASILSLTHLFHLRFISISTNSGSIPRYKVRGAGQFPWGPSWPLCSEQSGARIYQHQIKNIPKEMYKLNGTVFLQSRSQGCKGAG